MPYLYALADALLVHLKDSPAFRLTIPSKTIAYLACARPIIMAVSGDAADFIRSAAAGVVCPPDDPKALAEAVRKLCGMSTAERRAMGQAGRRLFLTSHARNVVMPRYEALLNDVRMCKVT
jgi:glycosyltransferase involved in cell wall biosynthesis